MALEIEDETLKVRSDHTKQIMQMEEKKNEIRDRLDKKYQKEINYLKEELEDKHIALTNMQKLINKQEKEIENLKEKTKLKEQIDKAKSELIDDEQFN
jgi:predicted  nucleic acid-binding Zn-ribbon protein